MLLISNNLGGNIVIDYAPFWDTLEKSNENWYTLTKKHKISSGTMSRLKNNKDISTRTINDLCMILHCDVKDILRFKPSADDQSL